MPVPPKAPVVCLTGALALLVAGCGGPTAPPPAAGLAVAALEGNVYVIGGLTGSGGVTSRVEAYDPDTDAWTERAPLPAALHHPAAAGAGGRLYVLGGFDDRFAPASSLFEYDPRLDTWSARADMPTSRGALAAATLDGRVYAIGGVKGFGQRNVGSVEVCDPATDTWSALASMKWARGVRIPSPPPVVGLSRRSCCPTRSDESRPQLTSWEVVNPHRRFGGTPAHDADCRPSAIMGQFARLWDQSDRADSRRCCRLTYVIAVQSEATPSFHRPRCRAPVRSTLRACASTSRKQERH